MKTPNEAFLYCWINKDSGKKYIGYHKGTYDDGYISSGKSFNMEYVKNPDNFVRQIIADGTVDDIRTLENRILEAVNAANSIDFYNKHNGGTKFFPDSEARAKAAVSNRGKKRSKEFCENISNLMKGKKRKPFTEETKHKMSEGQRLRGGNGPKKHTDEAKLKMSIARKGSKQSREHIEKRIATRMNTLLMRKGAENAE